MPVKVLYILVLAFLDSSTGEIVEEHRGSAALTFDECAQLLAPEARGPVVVKDGRAEIMWCEPLQKDIAI